MAAEYGHVNSINLLLEYGASVDIKGEDGMTPLAFAAKTNLPYKEQTRCKQSVEILISKGASIDEKAKNGMTPLAFAADSGRLGSAKILLENGANVNEKDKAGRSILDIAKKSTNKEFKKDVVKLLKLNGA